MILYRIGIVLSVAVSVIAAFLSVRGEADPRAAGALLLTLYFSVGLSVFFIHLYVGKFSRMLKKAYAIAILCLVGLFILGKGNPALPLMADEHHAVILLFPLSCCLGFITAKEAFCFKLLEGYLLALLMPFAVLLFAIGAARGTLVPSLLILIAALLVLFALRKVFMPIHCDIGDKSAYQP